MQMLVLVVLGALLGIGGLIKTRANKFKDREQDYPEYAGAGRTQGRRLNKTLKELKDKTLGAFLKTAQSKAIIEEPVFDFDAGDIARQRKPRNELAEERDLAGGMEMLEQDFLVRIVEKTEGDGKDDVMMRKLSFNELVRREQLRAADSNALKVYAMNEGNLYGKDIQCEAMKELAGRSGLRSQRQGTRGRISNPSTVLRTGIEQGTAK